MLEILKVPNPRLRKKASPVAMITEDILDLIDNMYFTMKQAGGCGLAAPQVGHSLRVILVDVGYTVEAMINPEIYMSSTLMKLGTEGCLSIPGKTFQVKRPENIHVRYIDEMGRVKTEHFKGIVARIVQHEIDHLNGVLIDDLSNS